MTKTVKIKAKRKPSSKSKSARKSRLEIAKKNKTLRGRNRSKYAGNKLAKRVAKVFLIFFAITLVGALGGSVYAFSWLQDQYDEIPNTEAVFPTPPAATIIYDRDGTELFRVIGDFNSDLVDIDEIPEEVKWAFLAAEDASFYEHGGFDTAGMVRCGVRIVSSGGADFCGGSTVTQQLIKITALSDEESRVQRKIKELFLSTRVEQESTKDEILQMYLSVTSFGSNVVGLEAAADYYFDKDPKDLTLAEATVLSSIIQNPAYLSPTAPIDGDTESAQTRVKGRQLYVLGQYEEKLDFINSQIKINLQRQAEINGEEFNEDEFEPVTAEEIEAAREQALEYQPPIATDKLAGHFVDYAISELTTKNYKNGEEPFDVSDLQNGGYKITTTLDYDLQIKAEEAVRKGGNDYDYWNVHNAAVMTMVPSTGQIITMAGSKSFTGESEGCDENGQECLYNPEVNALARPHSPGSTNKPLGYYKAYEQGQIFTGSFLPDIQVEFGNYKPKNWNSSFSGFNNYAEDALRKSLNIPALAVLDTIGIDTYLQTAGEFGYTTYAGGDFGKSVILGGADVLPVEHAAAYGVFANQGDYVRPETILKIEDRNGKVIYEARPEPKRVADPAATHLLNQSLYHLNDGRNDLSLLWDGRPFSAKTGTAEASSDAWLALYSPDFVTLGWAGNNNNNSMDLSFGYPTFVVSPWMMEYQNAIGDSEFLAPRSQFPRPAGVYRGGGDCGGDGKCLGIKSGWLIEGKTPPKRVEKKKFDVCSDQDTRLAREIDEVLGFTEEREFVRYEMPASSWNSAYDRWLQNKDISNAKFPTEDCNIDRSGGDASPILQLEAPIGGITIDNNLRVAGLVYALSGEIQTLQVFIDGQFVGDIPLNGDNFDQTFDISALSLDDGVYPVRIDVTDTNGGTNSVSAEAIYNSTVSGNLLLSLAVPPALTWGTDIGNGITQDIRFTYSGINTINNVELYQVIDGSPTLVGNMNLIGGEYRFDWGGIIPDVAGTYSFYVVAYTAGGGRIQSAAGGDVVVTASI